MSKISESLSIEQARKLVLLSQRIPSAVRSGNTLDATLEAVEHLGYIQIDTISAIQRAHHHTLWNRNPRYHSAQLEQLIENKKVFEYWSHAASFLPMRDFRFSLPRKHAIAMGEQNHWHERDEGLMKMVLDRITSEGPLMTKDFESISKKSGEWQSKPAKRALEQLFMQGELMIPYRNNFHKVYDLSTRVLPENIDTSMPDSEEYGRYLIKRFLRANGLGQVAEMNYLLKNTKQLIANAAKKMLVNGELRELTVGGNLYYALPSSLELLNSPLARNKLKILSPFDNLLIQRKRIKDLFDFDYLIECYVPEAKRQYGYFSLPILWDGRLVARMDCKAERKKALLHIQHLALEPHLKKTEAFARALHKELLPFMQFNNCSKLILHKTSPAGFNPLLESTISA